MVDAIGELECRILFSFNKRSQNSVAGLTCPTGIGLENIRHLNPRFAHLSHTGIHKQITLRFRQQAKMLDCSRFHPSTIAVWDPIELV